MRSIAGARALPALVIVVLTGAAFGLPVGTLGFPSVQGAVFLDVGQAWEEGRTPDRMLGSFGLGFRSNLGGFLVLRLDLSRRTDFNWVSDYTDVDFFVGFNY